MFKVSRLCNRRKFDNFETRDERRNGTATARRAEVRRSVRKRWWLRLRLADDEDNKEDEGMIGG